MASETAPPKLKAGLEILRDSVFVTIGVTVVIALLRDSVTLEFFSIMGVEVFIYTFLIMYLAYEVFERIWILITDKSRTVQWTVFVIVMLAISAVGSFAGSLIIRFIGWETGVSFAFMFQRSFGICAVVSLLVGVNEAAFDMVRGQLDRERVRAQKLETEARLGALEARLHPHFLFNALNSISSLIASDPERAERLVERVASLLRFSLDTHKSGLVAVEQELRIVRAYLEIEQARLGKRLRYGMDAAGDLEGVQLPPLSVQTLVENSIKFAVAPSLDGGEVRVRVSQNNGSLHVDVADTGSGFVLESAPAGHGLDNLRGRLDALFGSKAELKVGHENGWTTVSMKVPV